MKNSEKWTETKFLVKNGKLRPNPKQVSAGSLYIANLVARSYSKILPTYCSGKLLDLGCGYVPFYSFYKNYVDEVYCVDWENSLHKNIFLDFHADLNQSLQIEAKDFDCIILSDVFEHIYKPDVLWNSINEHIKQKGKVIINVPFFYWLHEAPHDYHRYTKYYFKQKAAEYNFTVLHLEEVGGLNDILVDLFSKSISAIPGIGPLFARFTYLFLRPLSTLGIWKLFSKKSGNKFPLGYTVVLEKN